jgi:vitamin B12/bleomycin/antimicrobial peptide transport system ATP-binding/permease protein
LSRRAVFTSEDRWTAWLPAIGVIGLTLLQIGFAVRLNVWNRDFFNALESRDWNVFISQMGILSRCCAARRWDSPFTRSM